MVCLEYLKAKDRKIKYHYFNKVKTQLNSSVIMMKKHQLLDISPYRKAQ